ncbi:Calmodulin [Physocladia obscura]|uniref:Calmodulin n=1 Tax=Physocladia obscura TaxID=109957 RepID=A0AAD5SNL8_9FUNG|nr:Calmodulin [Physocladia obscura]
MAPLPPQRSNASELPGTTKLSPGNMFGNQSNFVSTGINGGTQSVSVMASSRAKQLFDRYDNDGSGSISISEFRNLCYDMGYFLTDEELALDIKLLDADGNGTLSYDEYGGKKTIGFLDCNYLIKRFDKDGSGIIDIREFKNLYIDLVKRKMAKKSLMATLQDIDTNRDGKVSFNEYVQWALKHCTASICQTDISVASPQTIRRASVRTKINNEMTS